MLGMDAGEQDVMRDVELKEAWHAEGGGRRKDKTKGSSDAKDLFCMIHPALINHINGYKEVAKGLLVNTLWCCY
jgi:hypothetical protein